ncbi:MAG TPA: Stf0 family sulfotransferase [Xanthobacteraceae bacterium]
MLDSSLRTKSDRIVESADNPNRRATKPVAPSVRWLTDPQFDFPESTPLRKSYVIASSDRAAGALLCRLLWQTGSLGAPWEYLNSSFEEVRGTLTAPADRSITSTMIQRFGARSPGAYIARLLACRTSSNGVFGLKSNFDDLKSALNEFPNLLKALAPVSYVYVDRRDKLAHAASAARSLARSLGTAGSASSGRKVPYQRDMISKSLGKLERQRVHWWRWFETNGIEPLVVYYEDVTADGAEAVRSIVSALGATSDAPNQIVLPPFDQRPDAVAEQWAARFRHEIAYGISVEEFDQAGSAGASALSGFVQMSPRHANEELETSRGGTDGDDRNIRSSLPRYDQIIRQNRPQLQNAIVLDLMSGRGMCSLAALDAGAAFVTAVDPRQKHTAMAARALADRGFREGSYQLVTMGIMQALQECTPETFGVIIGRGVLERIDLRRFFAQLKHLRPKHVILDTVVTSGQGPLVRFGLRGAPASGSGQIPDRSSIIALPNHDLIALLCDNFGFKWRLADEPNAAGGGTARTGRASVKTSTYILDRIV